MFQGNAATVRSVLKDFSATGKDSDQVAIHVLLSNVPQILFGGVNLVEAFFLNELVQKNDLSSILYHAVAGKTLEDECSFVRVFLEKFVDA